MNDSKPDDRQRWPCEDCGFIHIAAEMIELAPDVGMAVCADCWRARRGVEWTTR